MATEYQKWIDIAEKLGLKEEAVFKFVKERQTEDREERVRRREEESEQRENDEKKLKEQREYDKEQREYDKEQREYDENRLREEREFELRKIEMMNDNSNHNHDNSRQNARVPRLPSYCEKENMDAYLERFERFATNQKWAKDEWATYLSALLTGKATEVYARMPYDESLQYSKLKDALLRKFDLTKDGFRDKFKQVKPEDNETPSQFVVRISGYLDRWIELARIDKTYKGLFEMIVREQFLSTCDKDLNTYLNEHDKESLDTLTELAITYLSAHKRTFGSSMKQKDQTDNRSRIKCDKCHMIGHVASRCKTVCYNCSKIGHRREDCKAPKMNIDSPNSNKFTRSGSRENRECFICSKRGHIAADCRSKTYIANACVTQPHTKSSSNGEIYYRMSEPCECIKVQGLRTASGQKVDIMSASCISSNIDTNLPVSKGYIMEQEVQVLRDSGCSGVIVKRSLVRDNQLNGSEQSCMLADGSIVKMPLADIEVNTPYFIGKTEAMCMNQPAFDLILGNIPGVRKPEDPDPEWRKELKNIETSAVVTRAQLLREQKVRQPLKVKEETSKIENVDPKRLIELQKSDVTLSKVFKTAGKQQTRNNVFWYETQKGITYRIHKTLGQKRESIVKQLVVPKQLRKSIMSVAHESILAGHMGVNKTLNRIKSAFYWPCMDGDVRRYCQSCDVCQRTIAKGRVVKVPVGEMPMIDVPFKRVGMDLVGPIYPASERGHRYFLTIVDYATRYPEAVPLKGITTEEVAEAMFSVFSRVGFPNEVLSDQGSQFLSSVMKEVARLMSIKQITTSPYNPRCNGLTEKLNGVIKTMLKRLTVDKPKDWDRYIDALLFAYREVPQDSTGYSPFELLYGRTVRGPMQILQKYWTQEDLEEGETKNSYQYVLDLKERLESTCEIATEIARTSQKRYKRYYDKKARNRVYQVGDRVLLLLPTDKNKLLLQWKGPFEIVERRLPCDYRVDINGKVKTFHINMLKKYISRVERDEEGMEVLKVASAAIRENDDLEIEMNTNMYYEHEDMNDVSKVVIDERLSASEKSQMLRLLKCYPEVFSDIPGCTDIVEHAIVLNTQEPIRTKMYPMPYSVREAINTEIQDMIKLDIIEETESPYASPIVLIKKKDNTNRFCVDYRKINKATLFDPEPMPKSADIFTKLRDQKYVTKVDLSKGYWQISVKVTDRPKTAFISPNNTCYQFKRMPFGLMNSAASFNRMVRKLLRGMKNVDGYVDDILVYTKTWQEHLEVLEELLKRLKQSKLTIKTTKCLFGFREVEYVGHMIGLDKIGLLETNLDKIRSTPRPTNKKQVKSFLGLANYYRNHITGFATMSFPLTELTKKGQPNIVNWQSEHQIAFQKIINALSKKPILHMPDFDKTFIVQVDASDVGIGATLLQQYGEEYFPISYASRKLLPRERRYAVIEKECLAVVYAVKKFNEFLYGREFVLQTDHQPLVCLNHSRVANDRIMRWSLMLQPYSMRIEAIKGSENVIADYLSRCEM